MTPQPNPSTDPTLEVAERQLLQLRELAEIAMAAARAFGESAVACAGAEKQIVGEDWFTPEVGRARACGARDAAESIQKVTRAARLTMKLEMAVAEMVRDIRAGIVTHSTPTHCNVVAASGTHAGGLTGACPRDRDSDWTRQDADTERLVEFDRPETLPRAPLRDTVEEICADLGVTVDWKTWTFPPSGVDRDAVRPPALERAEPPPPGVDLSP